MSTQYQSILTVLNGAPVVPVITLDRAEDAEPLADALLAGGLAVLEVTLRTPAALDGIAAMAKAFPEALVAAGTVLSAEDLDRAIDAGAKLAISPGATPGLLAAAAAAPIPFMPAIATASEAMRAREHGFRLLKFFPAQAAGGAAALKGFAGPLADLRFCPTGGVSLENMASYLRLPNVVAVGGSWMVPQALIRDGRFSEIESLARAASASGLAVTAEKS
ncbi:MAG: 2-dehydro-3-deoxy-phosphogluconate aldolase [Sphingomonadales bacterium]